MENKKISVAIDTRNEKKNIIRAVNSIKRQVSYDDILMVLLYDENKDQDVFDINEEVSAEISEIFADIDTVKNLVELRKLLEEQRVEKLIFVNTEIVLAPNAITVLLAENSEEQLVLNHVVSDTKGNYVEDKKVRFSPYCKLYVADDLFGIDEASEISLSQNLQLRYSLIGKEIKTVDAYAYQSGNTGICVDYETGYEYIKSLLDNEDVVGIDVVADIVEETLYKALRESLDKENGQAFALLQKCMGNLTFDKDILELEFRKYKITPELFEIIGRCNVSQFKKMYEKFGALSVKCNTEIQTVNVESQQIVRLQDTLKNLEIRVNGLEQEQNGYEAAQHVVKMYQNGKLGMGTIIKSAVAWIKYKLSGKR